MPQTSKKFPKVIPSVINSRKYMEQFCNVRLFEDDETALQWVSELPKQRQIYSEIEDNPFDTSILFEENLYLKRGINHSDETGLYAVIQDDRFQVQKYENLEKPKEGIWKNIESHVWTFEEAN